MKACKSLMASTLLHIIVLTITLFFVLPTIQADLIQSTCKNTPNPDLCISILKSDPKSSKTNIEGLAEIAARRLLTKATEISNQIKKMREETSDPELKEGLSNCVRLYNVIVNANMMEAIQGITLGNPKFAQDGANDAAVEANACERSFKKSPITNSNKFVHDLALVVSSIVNDLL